MHGIADLEIVEFASVLAGPLAANLFSEMGAKVTKIENSRTGGDITRHWRTASESKDASVSSYYASANFQKEVIMADLRDPAERERAMRYVDKADVIISNFKPDTARKLGVSFEALRQRNAKAVIAELVGYRENPERGAFDVLLQAEAGYLSMTGHPHSPFAKIPVAMIDILAAHQLRAGILAALYQRLQDGKGRRVEVDLYSAALSGLINQGSAYLMHQDIARPMGSAHPSIVPYGEIYHTLDDVPLVLAIGTDAQFGLLCELLGIDSLPHWSTNKGRVEDREELQKRMIECIGQWKYSELRAVFTANEIPFARVNDVGEALSQNKAAKYILESEQEDVKLRALRSVTFTLASE